MTHDPAPAIDREFQGHALDAQQLADAARYYADALNRGARTEDADRLASLATRLARQAHRIDGMREIARCTPTHDTATENWRTT
ncbi:hypothetical protein [Streptomyces sp. NRRL WC-3742]|uniref:hypothetical protein n=1 Tax=Streptomyces sp. NRRL WC-3742 TaxID=1463934 RepID=UPI0004C8AA9B|nr:hypothetical protein [Streptomyces sp. NRRL WC-3742]